MRTKSVFAIVMAAVLLAMAGSADAKTVKVVPGDPPVTAEIPADWTVSQIDRGVQAKTADEEVYLWFESYKPSQLEALLGEHNAYFKKQGVAITGTPTASEKEFPTYFLKISDYPATYEDKPTVLRYVSVVPKSADRRSLLISYWASPEGDKDYDSEMDKIMNSVRASIDAQ